MNIHTSATRRRLTLSPQDLALRELMETQAELCERRGREFEASHKRFMAEVEKRRAAGIPDVPCALPAALGAPKFDPSDRIQGRPRKGTWS